MARAAGIPLPTITDDRALGAADIQRCCRFNDGAQQYMTRTPSSAGNRKIFTLSVWIKRCALGTDQPILDAQNSSSDQATLRFSSEGGSDDKINVFYYNGSSFVYRVHTNAKLRDVTGWYHIVIAFDTTQATAANRIKIYQNGVQLTDMGNSDYPSQNYDTPFNNTILHTIGRNGTASNYFDGYMSEFNFIDGQQLDSSYFGFTDSQTGIWMPKRYEGTYGTNGFYLDFSDNSSAAGVCIDKSPNGNDFTPSSLNSYDSLPDTPTNNFPNFLTIQKTAGSTFTEGDLKGRNTTEHKTFYGNIGLKSGKWYWEAAAMGPLTVKKWTYGVSDIENTKNTQIDGQNYLLAVSSGSPSNATYAYGDAVSIYNDAKKKNGSHAGNIDGYTIEQNDIIGVALDVDAGKVWYRIGGGIGGSQTPGSWLNGVTNNTYNSTTLDESGHDATLTTGKVYVPAFSAEGCSWKANFGQDSSYNGSFTAQNNKDENGQGDFYYPVPKGFKAICTANLTPNVPSIRPQKHFDIITYTGTDSSAARTITGLEFTPDLIWQKRRNGTNWNTWHDTVRGVGKTLYSNGSGDSGSSGQTTNNQYGYISAFGTNGFTWSPGSTNNSDGNETDGTFVSWCWKAGGAAVSNSDGSVTSSVSANQEAGFSIVKWTTQSGAYTVGHGLGRTPEMIMSVHLSNTGTSWPTFTTVVDGTMDYGYISANSTWTDAVQYGIDVPNSTTFQGHSNFHASSGDCIAYCWASIPGYSKIGMYKGNGDANGTYVHLGFRPALVIVKNMDTQKHWGLYDNKRSGFNPNNHALFPSDKSAEDTSEYIDFLSDGFKLRSSALFQNKDGDNLIYMAFAEQTDATPFDTFPNAR